MTPPFGVSNHPIPHVSFDQYVQDKRLMDQNIISQLQPDYLILSSEPSTKSSNAGMPELSDPGHMQALVNYVLNRDGATVPPLDKGSTLVGAGAGTWDSVAFDRNYVTIPGLDFISLHVYPLTGQNPMQAVAMAQLANTSGKRLVIDEAWLYKTTSSETPRGPTKATFADVFKRDMFSFFEPEDEQFMQAMTSFAEAYNAEFVSFFWARNMFGAYDYVNGDESRTVADLQPALNRAAARGLANGELSPTGRFYQSLTASLQNSLTTRTLASTGRSL